ncbi:glycosyltransferase family 2 protein [Flavobacterium sinopsychrotolerans]|nr:glycosyltransferase family 2 protein [Flavobacterium sinopsychrotolerans]
MNNPKVSIIVPCYNQAQYLDEALQSVLEQTYANWECIIVNDGSPDNTKEVANKWVEKDSRFKYAFQENGGLSSARNVGLNIAKGDYIQFLDSDDFLDFKKLESSLIECNNINSDTCKIIISNFRMFTIDKNVSSIPFCELRKEYFTFEEMIFGWDYKFNIPIHCGFFDTKLFQNFRFSIELKAKEDWIMWLTFFKNHAHCVFIDKPLVLYRIHSDSMTKEVEIMEDNYFKAILSLQKLVPEKVYNDYLIFVLNKKMKELVVLKKYIINYQNSNGFKILERFKKIKSIQLLVRFLK